MRFSKKESFFYNAQKKYPQSGIFLLVKIKYQPTISRLQAAIVL